MVSFFTQKNREIHPDGKLQLAKKTSTSQEIGSEDETGRVRISVISQKFDAFAKKMRKIEKCMFHKNPVASGKTKINISLHRRQCSG